MKKRNKKAIIRIDDHRRSLNKEVKEIREPEKAAEAIERYEDIIKMKKKGIISAAYYQGKVFKIFKEKEKFVKIVSEKFTKPLLILKLMF